MGSVVAEGIVDELLRNNKVIVKHYASTNNHVTFYPSGRVAASMINPQKWVLHLRAFFPDVNFVVGASDITGKRLTWKPKSTQRDRTKALYTRIDFYF